MSLEHLNDSKKTSFDFLKIFYSRVTEGEKRERERDGKFWLTTFFLLPKQTLR